jgi:hypothetical protein
MSNSDAARTGQEVRIEVREARDPARVESEVGVAFYTHLRGLGRVADVRYENIERAIEIYRREADVGAPEPTVAGYGLLVMQRVTLVAEDLLGLLWALPKADPWKALTGYYARDLDKVARTFLEGHRDLHAFLLIPSDQTIHARIPEAPVREAVTAWAAATRDMHDSSLKAVCGFWLDLRHVAKATMHGFGMVARQYLVDPPGGGRLSEFLSDAPRGLYAMNLDSRRDDDARRVETTQWFAPVDRETIEMMRGVGAAASNLLWMLRSAQLARLANNAEWHIHGGAVDSLTPQQKRVLHSWAAQQ